jgi:hypothetical protein
MNGSRMRSVTLNGRKIQVMKQTAEYTETTRKNKLKRISREQVIYLDKYEEDF